MHSNTRHHFCQAVLSVLFIASVSGCSLWSNSDTTPKNASNETINSAPQTSSDQSGTIQEETNAVTSAASSQTTETNSNATTSGMVTPTTLPEQVEKAKTDLELAQTAIDNSSYIQAFTLATSSYTANPSEEARTIALYAASRLTPIELMRLDQQASTHFEQAIIGQLRLNICAAQQDNTCVNDVLPRTIASLEMLGDMDAASRLRSFQASGATSRPLVSVLLPLSGNDRKIGRAMLGAILQASGIYSHQSLPFDLRFFDTQTSPQNIESIIAQANALGSKLLLGPIDIRECMMASQKIDAQSVMIGFSPNDEFIRQNPNIFQYSYALTEEAQQLAQLLVSINATQIVAVGPEDAYTTTTVQHLQNSIPANITLSQITFPSTQTDLREIAKKIAKSSPDVVFLPTTADVSERIANFMAQENIWCKTPGTPPPKAVADMRKFVTCIAPSSWAPIVAGHNYKSIVEAIYLDYNEAAAQISSNFETQFETLYHRLPSVQEILPYMAISMLKTLPESAWKSTTELTDAIQNLFRSQRYLILPGYRQVTAQSSQSYSLKTSSTVTPSRTLVTAQ